MADNFYGRLQIGGPIPKSCLASLRTLINTYFSDAPDFSVEVEFDFEEGAIFTASDGTARYGGFKELEEFCEDNGISYDRRSDSFCDYDAELIQHRPGAYEYYTTGVSGFPVWTWAEIEAALKPLVTSEANKHYDEIVGELKERLRHDVVPPLTPLVFVDIYPKVRQ